MNGCFDIQLPAVVFDGVKTSRMLSCEAVTIGRDVTGVASLAWGGVRGTGGDWSVRSVTVWSVTDGRRRHSASLRRRDGDQPPRFPERLNCLL